jgi:hypothetical protein
MNQLEMPKWRIGLMRSLTLLMVLVLWGPFPPLSQAGERFVITRKSLPFSQINDLVWLRDELKVQNRKSHGKIEYYVVLEGRYLKPKYDLYVLDHLVTRAVSGDFTFKIACKDKPVQVSLRALGPLGVLEREEVLLLKTSRETVGE